MEHLSKVITFIREARNESDSLYEQTLFFVSFLMIGGGVLLFASLLIMAMFTFPKVIIPLYFTIFVLWKAYQRL